VQQKGKLPKTEARASARAKSITNYELQEPPRRNPQIRKMILLLFTRGLPLQSIFFVTQPK
jgi:hypothetical protein